MSRKSVQTSPMGLAMAKNGAFMQKHISQKHQCELMEALLYDGIKTYGDLKKFLKKCEAENDGSNV